MHPYRLLIGEWRPMAIGSHHSLPLGDKEVAVEVGIEPTGEWSEWCPFGAVERRTRNARRVWFAHKDFQVPAQIHHNFQVPAGTVVPAGTFFEEVLPDYYREHRGDLVAHDICMYCGTDNGPAGEYRQGWDCWQCGGN